MSAVEDLDDLLKAFVLAIADGLSDRLDLLPGNAGEVGDDVDDLFKRLLLYHHLLVVKMDASVPLSVVRGPVVELRGPAQLSLVDSVALVDDVAINPVILWGDLKGSAGSVWSSSP